MFAAQSMSSICKCIYSSHTSTHITESGLSLLTSWYDIKGWNMMKVGASQTPKLSQNIPSMSSWTQTWKTMNNATEHTSHKFTSCNLFLHMCGNSGLISNLNPPLKHPGVFLQARLTPPIQLEQDARVHKAGENNGGPFIITASTGSCMTWKDGMPGHLTCWEMEHEWKPCPLQLGLGCFWKAHQCQSCCTLGRAYGIRTLDRCSNMLGWEWPAGFPSQMQALSLSSSYAILLCKHFKPSFGAYGCVWPVGPLLTMWTPSMTATPYNYNIYQHIITIRSLEKNTKQCQK